MRFPLPFTSTDGAAQFLARTAGYIQERIGRGRDFDEERFIRPLRGASYPRFHASVTEHGGKVTCSLHLDQKRPSYEGSHAHSGEYDGPVLEEERTRILSLLP